MTTNASPNSKSVLFRPPRKSSSPRTRDPIALLEAIADLINFRRDAPADVETFLRFAIRSPAAAEQWATETGLGPSRGVAEAIRSKVPMAVMTGIIAASLTNMPGKDQVIARMNFVERQARSAQTLVGKRT